MAQQSNNVAIELFKKVYGSDHDLVPDDQPIAKEIPWSDDKRVGDTYTEAVILGSEVGISLGGTGQEAFQIGAAIAGAVRQTEVKPYVSILPSILPFATISRSIGDEQAFMNATKFITKNNLKSHNRFLEIFRLYGQSDGGLGYVSYATATYRGVALTNGGGAVGGVTFTAGVNTTSKHVMFQPGTFAAGHWVGMRGVKVNQVATATGLIVASGKLTSVDAKYGIVGVDFTPIAATSATSHKLVFDKMEDSQEMIGIEKILRTSGTLFGINNSQFELFRGGYKDMAGKKLTLKALNEIIADGVNASGMDGDLLVLVNPRTWGTMASDEAAFRKYDASYSAERAKNGFKDIEFYTQTGLMRIKAHRGMKEGDALIMKTDSWSRSGSSELGFKVPGMPGQDLIKELDTQAGFQFKSFADQYIFCHAPSQNIWINGINDESAT